MLQFQIDFPVTYVLDNDIDIKRLSILARQVLVKRSGNTVSFTPQLVYDHEITIPVFAAGTDILDYENNCILKRNRGEEKLFRQAFIQLHPSFKEQCHQQSFYLAKSALKDTNWLTRAIHALNKINIVFNGLDRL
ncbi:hypothetical protein [Pedobacter cryoconitis]|uniref:Uncharacterized protein n=1 Tax=Pedobacter cryoconitis TaxID=188932 RepID=A0A7X0J8Q1_9SPHI|nr:hypothetical protein [Pedobacter cryoconitis]MBB6503033.1 hypothetical protein [Pedobacter cryoconitis]